MKSIVEVKNIIYTVDDDQRSGWILSKILSFDNNTIKHFNSGLDLLDALKTDTIPDLILADLQMPLMDGIELLQRVHADFPEIPVVIMTAFGTIETAVRAIKAGAAEFITKPIHSKEVKEIVRKVLRDRKADKGGHEGPFPNELDLVGKSPIFIEAQNMVKKIAKTDITVLLRGESGTGKEVFAQTIHDNSSRKAKPYVAIDCATLPETLMESELFGHEKGAFTDARTSRIGKFEMANGGTLFLDEIGNLTPSSQMKILRAIQERTIERLGSQKTLKIDVRIIAATNVNLEEAMHQGLFREDLYFRLNEITVWIPPLRKRPEDIELFSQHFLKVFNKEFNCEIQEIHPDTMEILKRYRWPGNVREFKNVIKRGVILAQETIRPKDLPEELLRSAQREATPQQEIEINIDHGMDLKELARIEMQRIEKKIIQDTLSATNWHLSKTSKILGVDRKTLRNKMKSYGIKKD